MEDLARDSQFKVKRYEDEIYLYKAWHDNGFVTLYINESTDKELREVVTYDIEGLEIDGLRGEKQVHVNVGPGEKKMIKLVNTGSEGSVRKLQSQVQNIKVKHIKKPDRS